MIQIDPFNEVYVRLRISSKNIAIELNERFSFEVPGARFMPAYRFGWDGKIRLYNMNTSLIYKGLIEQIKTFCSDHSYECINNVNEEEPSTDDIQAFIDSLNLPFPPRDYQLRAVVESIKKHRLILLSPTSSGKSLIMYMLARYYNLKTLIIVPNVGLINQLSDDFQSYGYTENIHKIQANTPKSSNELFTISTWQSIMNQPTKWFDDYKLVIVDEVHGAQAPKLKNIMENLVGCKYRFGLSGTLDGTKTSETVLNGLFGPTFVVTETATLIENKIFPDMDIKVLVFEYSDSYKKEFHSGRKMLDDKKKKYQFEVEYINNHSRRNKVISFIPKLHTQKNILVLFERIEHGKHLFELIKKENPERDVFYVYGKVKGKERNEIRKLVETKTNAIIVASSKTFSTGINIPSLSILVLCQSGKARIKILQSIGRVLRKPNEDKKSIVYDLADDLSWKRSKNYGLDHMNQRLNTYIKERYKFSTKRISL